MDPWVATQIRLAERQGLLVGLGLGPVQIKAVFLCEMVDLAKASKQTEQDLRRSLLSTGKFEFADLFPEYAPGGEDRDEIDEDLASDEAITWVFPDPGSPGAVSPEEAEQILREMVDDAASGSVSAADLERDFNQSGVDWSNWEWGESP